MYRCEGCSYKARHYSDRLLAISRRRLAAGSGDVVFRFLLGVFAAAALHVRVPRIGRFRIAVPGRTLGQRRIRVVALILCRVAAFGLRAVVEARTGSVLHLASPALSVFCRTLLLLALRAALFLLVLTGSRVVPVTCHGSSFFLWLVESVQVSLQTSEAPHANQVCRRPAAVSRLALPDVSLAGGPGGFLQVAESLLSATLYLFADALDLLFPAANSFSGYALHLAEGALRGALHLVLVHLVGCFCLCRPERT